MNKVPGCILCICEDGLVLTDFESKEPGMLAKARLLGVVVDTNITKHNYNDIRMIVDRSTSVTISNAFGLVDSCTLAFNIIFDQLGMDLDKIYKLIVPLSLTGGEIHLQPSITLAKRSFNLTQDIMTNLNDPLLFTIFEDITTWALSFMLTWHKMYYVDHKDKVLALDKRVCSRSPRRYISSDLIIGFIQHEDNTVITHGLITNRKDDSIINEILSSYKRKVTKLLRGDKSQQLKEIIYKYNGKVLPLTYNLLSREVTFICDKDLAEEELSEFDDLDTSKPF